MFLKTIILLLICFGNSSLHQDKKKEPEKVFVPTKEWKEIKEGEKVPSGLHYRINLSTGKKEARIINKDDKENTDSTKSFKLIEESDETEDALNDNELEGFLKNVNKENPENDMPKKFRTLDEIKKDLGDIKLEPKSDVEVLKQLFELFEDDKRKQTKDYVILDILRDLTFLGHQIDNGNEFYKLDGFQKIIYKELNSTNMAIKGESLKLFSVLAQNNPRVKVHILETGGITTLLRILSLENSGHIKKSALTALSCTLRTFPHAQNKFVEMGGLTIFTDLFKTESSVRLKLQIVTLLHDLIVERQQDIMNFEIHQFVDIEKALYNLSWCNYLTELLHDLVVIDAKDFDSIEKCLLAMKSMLNECKGSFKYDLIVKLHDQYRLLSKMSEDDTGDYFYYLTELTSDLLDNREQTNKEEL